MYQHKIKTPPLHHSTCEYSFPPNYLSPQENTSLGYVTSDQPSLQLNVNISGLETYHEYERF